MDQFYGPYKIYDQNDNLISDGYCLDQGLYESFQDDEKEEK